MNDRLHELPAWTLEPTLAVMEETQHEQVCEQAVTTKKNKKASSSSSSKRKLKWGQRLRRKSKTDGDVELGTNPSTSNSQQVFYGRIAAVERSIGTIAVATQKLHSLRDQALRATTAAHEQEASTKTRTLVHDTNQKAWQAKQTLEALQTETKQLQGHAKPSELR